MIKKLVSLLLCVVIMVSLIARFSSLNVQADTSVVIGLSPNKSTYNVGDQVTVIATVRSTAPIYAVTGTFTYNSSVLQWVSGGIYAEAGTCRVVDISSGENSRSYRFTFQVVGAGDSYIKFSAECSDGANKTSGSGGFTLKTEPITITGRTFDSEDFYVVQNTFWKTPHTFEAWIYFPKDTPAEQRGGVILGNYNGLDASVNFEIHQNGCPSIQYMDESGEITQYTFWNVNVYTGEWVHLAFVNDTENKKVICYVNGEEQGYETMTVTDYSCTNNWIIGGDRRIGNTAAFVGELGSVAVYTDARTVAEIQGDMTKVQGDGLLAAWNFSDTEALIYKDLSGNGYDAQCSIEWIDENEKKPVMECGYSMAVIGDTQTISAYYPTHMATLYDWILANKEAKNIQYVMGLGDIVNNNIETEWKNDYEQISKLNGVIPYSLVRGNHDFSEMFNSYFGKEPYTSSYGGSYDDKIENTWRELVVGEVKYLILTLNYGPSDDVLEWANRVVEAHPFHNVIVTTHAYLHHDGTTLDNNDRFRPSISGGYNNGDDVWEKLIRKHENIVLVLSAHVPWDDIVMTQTEGDHGNVITQMLISPQGIDAASAKGMVAMLYFSEDGSRVWVEYYSTVRKQYFKNCNQFEMQVHVVKNFVLGDCNNDNTLDAQDLIAIRRGFLDQVVLNEAADVTEDGKIDIKDLIRLKKMLLQNDQ